MNPSVAGDIESEIILCVNALHVDLFFPLSVVRYQTESLNFYKLQHLLVKGLALEETPFALSAKTALLGKIQEDVC